MPHLLGRRSIECVDDHLAQDARFVRSHAFDGRRAPARIFHDSRRKANSEIRRCASLSVAFVRKRRRNQGVHATLHFEGAGRDPIREGWFARRPERKRPVGREGARLRTDRFNLR
jgi:hypothetical protein